MGSSSKGWRWGDIMSLCCCCCYWWREMHLFGISFDLNWFNTNTETKWLVSTSPDICTFGHKCYSDIFCYDPLAWCGPILAPVIGVLEISSLFFLPGAIHLCHTVDSTCWQHTNALITHLHVHTPPCRRWRIHHFCCICLLSSSLAKAEVPQHWCGYSRTWIIRGLVRAIYFCWNYVNWTSSADFRGFTSQCHGLWSFSPPWVRLIAAPYTM